MPWDNDIDLITRTKLHQPPLSGVLNEIYELHMPLITVGSASKAFPLDQLDS